MAKKRHHRRRRSNPHSSNPRRRRRSNPRRHRRHHFMTMPRRHHRRRHNPGLGTTVSNLLPVGAGVVGGYFISRIVPASIPQLQAYNTGVFGYVLNGATGVVAAMLVRRFVSKAAGTGILLGTGLAIAVRLFESMSAMPAASAAVSGDLGYYVSDRFPFPQGNAGPYDAFPGSPFLSTPPFPATSAAAVRAGAAAAAAALPPASGDGTMGAGSPLMVEAERWGSAWR